MEILSPEDHDFVELQESCLKRLHLSVRAELKKSHTPKYFKEKYMELLADAAESHAEDHAALVAQMDIIQSHAFMERGPEQLPDLRQPYFAYMQTQTPRNNRNVFLGYQTYIDPEYDITIIDWRHAPIARLYFSYHEGDEYEEELTNRIITGILVRKAVITFDQGQLVHISTQNRSLQKGADNTWHYNQKVVIPTLKGGQGQSIGKNILGTGLSGQKAPVISALLDVQQYKILEQEPERTILIQGGAGSGKTTVGLHRIAWQCFKNNQFYNQKQALVISPTKGLASLATQLLAEINMHGIHVEFYDTWIEKLARKIYRSLPKRICQNTRLDVIKFKRHPALLSFLPTYVNQLADDIASRIIKTFSGDKWILKSFQSAPHLSLLERLNRLIESGNQHQPALDKFKKSDLSAFVTAEKKYLLHHYDDRTNLFTNKEYLRTIVELSNQQLSPAIVDTVFSHSKTQLSESFEKTLGHINQSIETLDGLSLDDGTPDEDGGTIDIEDLAICLKLFLLKTGSAQNNLASFFTYSQIFIDEAQDFSAIENQIIAATQRANTSLTVAGDHMQQIDPTSCFTDWQTTMTNLNAKSYTSIPLRISYRSPRPIYEFSQKILGPLATKDELKTVKDGAPVVITPFKNLGHATIQLVEALDQLTFDEPRATIAVICRNTKQAKLFNDLLAPTLPVRLLLDGDMEIKPGILIADIFQTKGLEFDYVILPDVTPSNYPNSLESRRLLYVAATRAIHQLWVCHYGKQSPILTD